jgi:hypothetical protein
MKRRLQNLALYWKARSLWEKKVVFKVFQRRYAMKSTLREESISAQILFRSLRGIFLTGIYAAVFVIAVEFLSNKLGFVKYKLGNDELGLLLSTVVTVSGVFLGLYFAAVSAVAGNLFMRAPSNLQRLFLRERKGQQYVRTLALTSVVGLYYLLMRAYGYQVGVAGPVLVSVLALYGVVRFMTLGFQVFYFIHPLEASSTVTGDAAYAINSTTVKGFGWYKPYMQYHARKQAREALGTLRALLSFGVEVAQLSDQQLTQMAGYVGGLLRYYIAAKKQIPSESLWFETKYQHQNWLLADSTAITMALNTGTTLAPKSVKEVNWFETECVVLILDVLKQSVEKGDWASAETCVELIISTLEDLGPDLYEKTGATIISETAAVIWAALTTSDNPVPGSDTERGHLALIDALGRLPIAMLVSLLRYIDGRSQQDLVHEIGSVKWADRTSIYRAKLPGAIIPDLETTVTGLATEAAIEHQRISPDWYLQTITTQQYLAAVKRYYDFLKDQNESFFEHKVNEFIKRKNIQSAAHMTERWVEYTNKLLTCGWRLQLLINAHAPLKLVHDLPWTTIDADSEKIVLQSYDKKAVDKLVQVMPFLAKLEQSESDLPDYFGQAYTFGVEAAYGACLDNDGPRFKRLFPSIFVGALSAYDAARKATEGWSEDSKIIFSSEPLEDLTTLSGFAKLYSELYDNQEIWETCEATWNRYLDGVDAKNAMELIIAAARYRDSKFVIMPKATLRTNWDIRFRQKLEEKGIAVDTFGSERVNHASPLIRIVGRQPDLMPADARNVFFVTYLAKHSAAQNLSVDIPDRRDLERQIHEETNVTDHGQPEESV